MNPRVITESGTEPITLDEAAENVKAVDNGDSPPTYPEAALIRRLITAARQACEDELEMSLVRKTLERTQDQFYPARIELPQGPVLSIESVYYLDADGVDTLLAADQYRLSTSDTMALLWPAYNVSWPFARSISDSVRVRYTVGYPSNDSPEQTVPAKILQAMHLFIAHYYVHREATVEDGLMELPLGARYLLSPSRTGLGV